ncbi:MAG: histidinol dehydrogenase [Bacteroidetes bacterium]|nr:histidinol dehydrogenase [Bacteroidota bacterium]
MNTIEFPSPQEWIKICKRPEMDDEFLESRVASILNVVKAKGDEALKIFTLQFDKVELKEMVVTEEEFEEAVRGCDMALKKAIDQARANIEKFHLSQVKKVEVIQTTEGVDCWRKSVPIDKVGLYIPGGTAPLFSTLLMLGIPAIIAGCREIILCTPLDQEGKIDPTILYTANLLGLKKIFKVGGVQAIAAMAYGTATVPRVLKIFGPGNQFVAVAKQLVNRDGVAIDMLAGPSELAIIADDSSVPRYVAADLLSQAEHGVDSQVMLVSHQKEVIKKVEEQIEIQLEDLPRKNIAQESLENSRAILVEGIDQAIEFVNAYAPEHLIICCKNEDEVANRIENAGSVFLGNYSPESVGDYASGTNHTLPTNGSAKTQSGISIDSFVKKITFQKLSKQGLKNIGETVELMAEAEQLTAHKNAVSIRLKD